MSKNETKPKKDKVDYYNRIREWLRKNVVPIVLAIGILILAVGTGATDWAGKRVKSYFPDTPVEVTASNEATTPVEVPVADLDEPIEVVEAVAPVEEVVVVPVEEEVSLGCTVITPDITEELLATSSAEGCNIKKMDSLLVSYKCDNDSQSCEPLD